MGESVKKEIMTAFRKLPEDEFILQAIIRGGDISQSDAIRMALREFAYNHGYALREYQQILLCLVYLTKFAKGESIQNLDSWVAKAERLLKKNKDSLFAYQEYPKDTEAEVLFSQILSRRRMAANQQSGRKRAKQASR
jgi:ribonucleotide reductase beta subunit family protein with ferritin-like domain